MDHPTIPPRRDFTAWANIIYLAHPDRDETYELWSLLPGASPVAAIHIMEEMSSEIWKVAMSEGANRVRRLKQCKPYQMENENWSEERREKELDEMNRGEGKYDATCKGQGNREMSDREEERLKEFNDGFSKVACVGYDKEWCLSILKLMILVSGGYSEPESDKYTH